MQCRLIIGFNRRFHSSIKLSTQSEIFLLDWGWKISFARLSWCLLLQLLRANLTRLSFAFEASINSARFISKTLKLRVSIVTEQSPSNTENIFIFTIKSQQLPLHFRSSCAQHACTAGKQTFRGFPFFHDSLHYALGERVLTLLHLLRRRNFPVDRDTWIRQRRLFLTAVSSSSISFFCFVWWNQRIEQFVE